MIQFFYVAFSISLFIKAFEFFATYLTASWYLLKPLLFRPFLKSISKNRIIDYNDPQAREQPQGGYNFKSDHLIGYSVGKHKYQVFD